MMERAGDQQRVTFGHLGVEGQYKEKGCSREFSQVNSQTVSTLRFHALPTSPE